MKETTTSFAFSPSQHHGHVLSTMDMTLTYDGGEWKAWQKRLRATLRRLLGDMPTRRVPLDVRRVWDRAHPLGRIEKIVFTAEPCSEIPAYVCIPDQGNPPYPWMVCLQGHSSGMHNAIAVRKDDETSPLAVENDRDYAIQCMRHGVAALCIEQRSLGERSEKMQQHTARNTCHDAFVQALMLGRTLLGERVFDVDRALDYLATRGDVDWRRIGVTGSSGGGTTSIYAAALLRRITFAMPVCSFCTFRDSKMALHHCACGYFPRILKYAEMADILGLFAPRPVVIVTGREDPIIPFAGVKRAFRHVRGIYRAAGAEKRCHLVVGNAGHRQYAEQAWPPLMREIERLR